MCDMIEKLYIKKKKAEKAVANRLTGTGDKA